MKKTKITLDINKIQYNYKLLRNITKQGELCIPMIKANAYGFNYYDVVYNLLNMEEPQRDFFIYSIEEGCELREQFGNRIRNIYCVTGPMEGREELYYKYNIIPVLNSLEHLYRWSNFAKEKNENLKCLLQFNLGLNRSGLQQSEIEIARDFVYDESNKLELVMIMGHLAYQHKLDSELGQKLTKKELELFENAYKYFPNIKRGVLGSEGILKIPEGLFEFSRPGTTLFTGQPPFEEKNIFKTAVTVISPVLLGDDKNTIYINFGINQGLATYYEKEGFIYINGEKILAKKVDFDKTYFEVENNEKYKNTEALLVGYLGDDYIDGYTFSRINGSVPEEELCKITTIGNNDYLEYEVLNGCPEPIKKPENLIFTNSAVFNKNGKIKKFTSAITEIRRIEEDGGCGYDGKEPVKKGDLIATFPIGYADGFNRKLSCNGIAIHILIDGKPEKFYFCGGVPMDQMCFKIPEEFAGKVKTGDKVIIVDESLKITTEEFCKKMNLSEEEIFFMVKRGNRINISFED